MKKQVPNKTLSKLLELHITCKDIIKRKASVIGSLSVFISCYVIVPKDIAVLSNSRLWKPNDFHSRRMRQRKTKHSIIKSPEEIFDSYQQLVCFTGFQHQQKSQVLRGMADIRSAHIANNVQ